MVAAGGEVLCRSFPFELVFFPRRGGQPGQRRNLEREPVSAWALAEENLRCEGEAGTQVAAVCGGSWRVTPTQLLGGAGEVR